MLRGYVIVLCALIGTGEPLSPVSNWLAGVNESMKLSFTSPLRP